MTSELIRPPRLAEGDHIVVVSPSSTIADRLAAADAARSRLEKTFGVEITYSKNARGQHFYSSGTARQRSDDIMSAFTDPTVRAVFFSTGGATAIDVVDQLDYDIIAANPKIVAGLSDSSTLLNAITARAGVVTFHGFEMFDFADQELPYAAQSLRSVLFEGWSGPYEPNPDWRDLHNESTAYATWREIRGGVAQGPAVGGNSDAFMQLIGTSYAPRLEGAMLFLETYRLQKRHIQALFEELKLRGAFDAIRGLVIGYCLGSDAPGVGNERFIGDIALEATDGYEFPMMQVGEIGHQVENLIVPVGAEIRIDASKQELHLLGPAVI